MGSESPTWEKERTHVVNKVNKTLSKLSHDEVICLFGSLLYNVMCDCRDKYGYTPTISQIGIHMCLLFTNYLTEFCPHMIPEFSDLLDHVAKEVGSDK